jgi:hypothetical protein
MQLLGTDRGITDAFYRATQIDGTPLPAHPFGLKTPPGDGLYSSIHPAFNLVGHPDGTNESVDAMTAVVRQFLRWYAGNPRHRESLYLRIIRSKRGEKGPVEDVYFEIGSSMGMHICGGCTDGYEGTGPSGTKRLKRLFNTVAVLFDVPLEEVTISDPTNDAVREFIHRARVEKRRKDAA